MDYDSRRKRLWQAHADEGAGALLVVSPQNVLYLSGFTGGDSWLLLGEGRAQLLTDFRYQEQAAAEAPGVEVVTRHDESLTELVARLLPPKAPLAFEAQHLAYTAYRKLAETVDADRLRPAEGWGEELRVIKNEQEVRLIRQAVAVAEDSFRALRAAVRPGAKEKDLADELVYQMRRRGAQDEAFPTIVAAGERGSLPHAQSTDRAIKPGEAILVDWGARVRFYNCDLTRVLFLGSIPRLIEGVYGIVAAAQQEAYESLRPGRSLGDVDAAARALITEAGHGEAFGHGLGHGVGLEVHERPTLKKGAEEAAQPGMVHTLEPAIYLPGVGGVRIEDMVLVAEGGAERLTSLPRDVESMVV